MVFAGIAIDDGRICIGTGTVRPQHFTLQRILEVYQLIFIEIDIAHLDQSPEKFKYILKFPEVQKYDKFRGDV